MKRRLLIFLLILILPIVFGCAAIGPTVTKWDQKEYEAQKKFAQESIKTWSLRSGFIAGLGLTSQVAFPIRNGTELRAIINSPALVLALLDLDETVKKLGAWNEEDWSLGFYLGSQVRAGSQATLQFIRDFMPSLMQYVPALFP